VKRLNNFFLKCSLLIFILPNSQVKGDPPKVILSDTLKTWLVPSLQAKAGTLGAVMLPERYSF